ncbi:hypothetical protein AABM02_004576 [Vibrio parahaemolyticus]
MRKLLIMPLLVLSNIVVAGDWGPVTEVHVINTGYRGGMILFSTTEQPHHNPKGNCTVSWYSVREDSADVKSVLSVLLAAQRSKAKIQVGVDSTKCSNDNNNYISVSRIRILP